MRSLRLADWPLRWKLLFMLLAASLVPMIVAAIVTFFGARTELRKDTLRTLSAQADGAARALDALHAGHLREAKTFARTPLVVSFAEADAPARDAGRSLALQMLRSLVLHDEGYYGAAIIEPSGAVALSTFGSGNPAVLQRCAEVGSQGAPAVLDVFLDTDGADDQALIPYAAPVFSADGSVAAVLVTLVRVSELLPALGATKAAAGSGAFVVVLDEHGIYLMNEAQTDLVLTPSGALPPESLEAMVRDQRFGPSTRQRLEPALLSPFFAPATAPVLDPNDLEGRDVVPSSTGEASLAVARRLSTVPWSVFLVGRQRTIDAPALLQLAFVAEGLTLLIVFLLGFFASRRLLLAPIDDLMAATGALAKGDHDARAKVFGRDEMGLLAARINEMAKAIASAREGLEGKVDERTIALEAASHQLSTQKEELLVQSEALQRQHEELIARNEEVERGSRMKSDFLANMSHELRTPLNSVIGFSDLMLDGRDPLTDRQRGYLSNVLSSGQHLLSLINDLLDLSKIEAGKLAIHIAPVRVADAVEDAVGTIRSLAEKKRIDIRAHLDPTPLVLADASKLHQILLNLLSNAVKFSPDGAVIKVSAEDLGGMVRFSVSDEGPGIDPALRPRLFQPFVQGESAFAKRHQGTGLGLAISKRLVEMHGGSIELDEDAYPGATFHFTIPTDPADEPVRSQKPSSRRLLLLGSEDLGSELKSQGYQVARVGSEKELIDEARASRPLAIVIDPTSTPLTSMNAVEVLRRAAETSDIPVVVATTRGGAEALPKPIEREGLMRSVARLTAGSGDLPRVLGIDDDPRVGVLLRSILEPEGYQVVTVESGEAGLASVRNQRPDLLIVDIHLPDLTGFELLDALGADPKTRGIPTLVLTAAEISHEERARLRQQASAIAGKGDFTRSELLVTIARAIEGQTKPSLPPEQEGTASVLVVDDHDLNRELASSILEQMGLSVLLAENGQEGVEMALLERPSLILMDLAMPVKDGFAATRELKNNPQTAHIPIVALTAMAMRGDEDKAREAGVDAYLSKPIDRYALVREVRRYVHARKKPQA